MSAVSKYPVEDAGPLILGATLTVTGLALITMVTRLYVRLKMIRNVGWDDYVMSFAMALCIAGQIIIIPQVYYGAGRHIDQIPLDDIHLALKLNFITQPIYLFAICIIKLSIGLFLLRIATETTYRRMIIGIMIFMGVYTVGCFFTIMFQCTNIAILWDPSNKGTCWGPQTLRALSYTNVCLNIVTDILFAIVIPIPMILKIQMNKRKKISLIGIMGLGIFATVAALIKAVHLNDYGKTGDWLWDSRNLTIWTVVETNVGIIAGNLPCMKPLFRTVLGSTYGRGSNARSASKYAHSGAYGTGVSRGRAADNYNSLASSRTHDNHHHHNNDDVLMMTNIDVDKEREGSTSSLNKDLASPTRTGTVSWLEDGYTPRHGISKTTEITTEVTLSRSASVEERIEVQRPERVQAHIV
ncbi:hypothetical protein BS50DRAFT_308404 [Corynespora cassiicola Philippines]|uniref:Rhodopsin domain-containing protein n=1 Tax=Corynespora cassiicola Philippines TaxID=1448308 RepID=A0A2T2NXR1_CORCC|nr:hypothetical protein BS50DRAFT_308404 [Corynespora cassiicola Philippines]